MLSLKTLLARQAGAKEGLAFGGGGFKTECLCFRA